MTELPAAWAEMVEKPEAGWGDPGTDKVPAAYMLQLQWEHAVCSSILGEHEPLSDEMHLDALIAKAGGL